LLASLPHFADERSRCISRARDPVFARQVSFISQSIKETMMNKSIFIAAALALAVVGCGDNKQAQDAKAAADKATASAKEAADKAADAAKAAGTAAVQAGTAAVDATKSAGAAASDSMKAAAPAPAPAPATPAPADAAKK
jgi:hypothetical protein